MLREGTESRDRADRYSSVDSQKACAAGWQITPPSCARIAHRGMSCERGFSRGSKQPPVACPPVTAPGTSALILRRLDNQYDTSVHFLFGTPIVSTRASGNASMKHPRVEICPDVMGGKPVIEGTRIPVELIVRKLSEGATEGELYDGYPALRPGDIRAALGYAADVLAHETIVVQSAY